MECWQIVHLTVALIFLSLISTRHIEPLDKIVEAILPIADMVFDPRTLAGLGFTKGNSSAVYAAE